MSVQSLHSADRCLRRTRNATCGHSKVALFHMWCVILSWLANISHRYAYLQESPDADCDSCSSGQACGVLCAFTEATLMLAVRRSVNPHTLYLGGLVKP